MPGSGVTILESLVRRYGWKWRAAFMFQLHTVRLNSLTMMLIGKFLKSERIGGENMSTRKGTYGLE
jgi:hypothetical protein